MNDGKDRFDDEIELIDYLRVIWKWKYLIMAGTAVCALAAAVISISMPKIYRVEMILEPGVAEIDKRGNKIYVHSPEDIKALIEGRAFNNEITKQLKNSDTRNLPAKIRFKVMKPRKTDLLQISYKTARVEMGISLLNQLVEVISRENDDKVKYFKAEYEKKIEDNKSAIYLFQDELRRTNMEISNIKKRLVELNAEIKKIEYNKVMLMKNRDKLIDNRSQNDIIEGIFYMNTIQQNLDLKNKINDQILNYTSEMERARSYVKKIQIKLDTLSKETEDLKQKKNEIKMLQVIQPPTISAHHIRPKTKVNIVLASAVGFLLSLFLAFLLDYLSKQRRDLN